MKNYSKLSEYQKADLLIWQQINQDRTARIKVAQSLCEQNDPRGQFDMAACYRHGWGVRYNIEYSIFLYDQAARQGHAGACYELARLYLQGNTLIGVSKDLNKAEEYADLIPLDTKEFDRPGYSQAEYIEQLNSLKKVIPTIRSIINRPS